MLYIKNHHDIKITKINDYSIHFFYENNHYLIHESSEDYGVQLYIIQDNKPKIISHGYIGISNLVNFRCKGRVYSQFDYLGFVIKLHHYGLIKSSYSYEVKRYKEYLKTKRQISLLINKL